MTRLFQYRFPEGSAEGLEGHSFGNLFIVAMSEVTGSMEEAIRETGRVLAVRGRILPSTLEDIRLAALTSEGKRDPRRVEDHVVGEADSSAVAGAAASDGVSGDGQRDHQRGRDRGGSGSLYTSVLPNLLVPNLRVASRSRRR